MEASRWKKENKLGALAIYSYHAIVVYMNKITKITTGTVILILALFALWYTVFAPTHPTKEGESSAEKIITATYVCAKNEKVTVLYDNRDKNNPLAIFSSQKIAKRTMPQVISGSGARYSDGVYVWWSKGDTGFLMEATGKESMVIEGCVVVK